MQKITTFLWFDNQAEEAIKFYTSIFKDSKIISETRWPAGGPGPAGSLLVASFQMAGQEFQALNGGPQFKFTEAISLVVNCENQEEVDYYWEKLLADGGAESQCGWLKDKYGLSWQVTPTILPELLRDEDREKAGRVMQAMMKMVKIDVQTLKDAAAGK
ncbi:MAG TPA: VOC family protein [Pyrinomonadaceae bacterium]|nr:VOC family protein [Pyrinomonadaceae bacterium]